MGRCPEAELIARYEKRIGWPVQITEIPDIGGLPGLLGDAAGHGLAGGGL